MSRPASSRPTPGAPTGIELATGTAPRLPAGPSAAVPFDRHALSASDGLPPRLFHEAVEQSSVAISITDTDAHILYVNPAFERLTGYGADDVIGRNSSMLSDRITPPAVYQGLWRTITDRRVWSGTLVNRRLDGSRYLAKLTIVPVLNAAGDIGYFLGMHDDVTEVRRLERKVRTQKTLIERVIDAAPMVMVLVDTDGRVLLDNHAYKCLMADLGGREPAELFLAALGEVTGTDLAAAAERGTTFANIEVRFDGVRRDGERWFTCSGSWVDALDPSDGRVVATDDHEAPAKTALLLVCNDITATRRRFDQAKTAAVRAAMAEQQMVAGIREALSGAIFQLQGPLNVMAAAADLCGRRCGGSPALEDALTQVSRSGQQALETLRAAMPADLLEPVAPVNLNEITREVLEVSVDRLLAEGAVVDWQPAAVLPSVTARASALRAVIKHLIDNALDALREGSRDRMIRITSGTTADRWIELAVEDGGPGLPDDIRLRVFEPFFSGWRRSRGKAGMGLSIVQQLVTELGGSVEIETVRPAGSDGSDGSDGARGRDRGCRVRVLFNPRTRPQDDG